MHGVKIAHFLVICWSLGKRPCFWGWGFSSNVSAACSWVCHLGVWKTPKNESCNVSIDNDQSIIYNMCTSRSEECNFQWFWTAQLYRFHFCLFEHVTFTENAMWSGVKIYIFRECHLRNLKWNLLIEHDLDGYPIDWLADACRLFIHAMLAVLYIYMYLYMHTCMSENLSECFLTYMYAHHLYRCTYSLACKRVCVPACMLPIRVPGWWSYLFYKKISNINQAIIKSVEMLELVNKTNKEQTYFKKQQTSPQILVDWF